MWRFGRRLAAALPLNPAAPLSTDSRFIPVTMPHLLCALRTHPNMSAAANEHLRLLSPQVNAHVHAEGTELLQQLKSLYDLMDPDKVSQCACGNKRGP